MIDQITVPLGSKSMEIQIGKLAKQADGAAVVRFGDTVVLATAVFAKEPKENADFFPLTVDYREATYAAGRIPGGWFKREGRPTEKEILTSRQIDRPMRPLFPKGFQHETQIIAFVLSADGQNDPDVLAINGASVALTCSLIPFYTPVGAVRVGRLDGRFVLNPTNAERDKSDIDLVVCGTDDAVCMVEAGAREVSERDMIDAILFGHEAVRQIVGAQVQLQRRGGFQKPSWQAPESYPASVFAEVRRAWQEPMMAAMTMPNKIASYAEIKAVKKAAVSLVPETEDGAPQADREGRRRSRQGPDARDDPFRQTARRPRLRRDPPDHVRGRPPSPHPRLGALHARRDAGARHSDPRHVRRRADHRGIRGRERAHVPAPLQLPALLGRRGQVPARPLPPRHRPRQPGAPGAVADASVGGGVPLHGPRRLRHPRVERFLLDGHGLRRHALSHGRRRSHQGAGGRGRDGPRLRRRPFRRPDRHRRPGGPLRRHGLQGRRVARRDHGPPDGHQDQGPAPRHPREGARTGARRPPPHPREDGVGHREPASEHLALRPAHLHDPDSQGSHPRRDRLGRQDDPLDHRNHRLQDRRRGLRTGCRSLPPTRPRR